MRSTPKFPLMVTCGVLAFSSIANTAPAKSLDKYLDVPEQPNVVILLADDLGYTDLVCMGVKSQHPTLTGWQSRV